MNCPTHGVPLRRSAAASHLPDLYCLLCHQGQRTGGCAICGEPRGHPSQAYCATHLRLIVKFKAPRVRAAHAEGWEAELARQGFGTPYIPRPSRHPARDPGEAYMFLYALAGVLKLGCFTDGNWDQRIRYAKRYIVQTLRRPLGELVVIHREPVAEPMALERFWKDRIRDAGIQPIGNTQEFFDVSHQAAILRACMIEGAA